MSLFDDDMFNDQDEYSVSEKLSPQYEDILGERISGKIKGFNDERLFDVLKKNFLNG